MVAGDQSMGLARVVFCSFGVGVDICVWLRAKETLYARNLADLYFDEDALDVDKNGKTCSAERLELIKRSCIRSSGLGFCMPINHPRMLHDSVPMHGIVPHGHNVLNDHAPPPFQSFHLASPPSPPQFATCLP